MRGAPERRAGASGVLAVVYVAAAAALAGVLVWPAYGSWRVVLVTAVGTVAGAGTALLGRWRAWSRWTTAAVAVAVYVVVAVPVAVPYRLGSFQDVVHGEVEAFAGVVVGWKQVLTLQPPVQEYRATLVPWFAAVLAATVVAAALAVRPGRRAALAVPTMGLLAALGAALVPVEPGSAWSAGPLDVPDARTTLPGLGLVAVSLLWLGVRARLARARAIAAATAATGAVHPRRRGPRASAVSGLVGAAVAAVTLLVTLLVVPMLSSPADRLSARAAVDPVLAVQAAASPLDGYRAAFSTDVVDTELLRATVVGDRVDRLRFAVLDQDDGQHLTTSNAGAERRFVRVPRSSAAGAVSTVTVEVGSALHGIWVPLPATALTAPRFVGSRADQLAATYYASSWASAGIVTAADDHGKAGLGKGVTYSVAAGPATSATLGDPAGGSLLGEDTHLRLAAWVKAQKLPRSAEGLTELVTRLRARGYLSHWVSADDAQGWLSGAGQGTSLTVVPARAGHSTARTEDLFAALTDQQTAVGDDAGDAALVAAVGDDEQFAEAVALLARYEGYEARVVLGVRLRSDDPSLSTCRDGVCTASDLAAWVEVGGRSGDWVSVDVDPQTVNAPRPVTQGQQLPRNPTQVQRSDPQAVDPPDTGQDSPASADDKATPHDAVPAWWWGALRVAGLSLAALLVVVAPVLTLPVAKLVRRRVRRRASVPEVAAVGAWAELADRCLDLGVPMAGGTRRAAAVGTGRPSTVALAELVDEAVWASAPPGPGAAAASWHLVEEDLALLAREHSAWARTVAALRPRSLVRALLVPRSSTVAPQQKEPT